MNSLSSRKIFFLRGYALALMTILLVAIIPIGDFGVSPWKVGTMLLAPFVFCFYPRVTKALIISGVLWIVCYVCASMHSEMRFSTLGYYAIFLFSYSVFYGIVQSGAIPLTDFKTFLKYFILVFGSVLLMQQISLLLGIRNFPLINLCGQDFLSITKLPTLTAEPSHTARELSVAMLSYIRCVELETKTQKLSLRVLFSKEHRWVVIAFLWTMLTMGSGTAFIGLGILCLYFLTRRNFFYILPVMVVVFFLVSRMEMTQFDRAVSVAEATLTGDVNEIMEADGSAAARVIPIVNTLTKTDLTAKETWIGMGTSKKDPLYWTRTDPKLPIIEQYGLIAFFLSLLLAFSCMIKRIISIETLIFLLLFASSLGNIYYTWGCMMMFTLVRYFQKQNE